MKEAYILVNIILISFIYHGIAFLLPTLNKTKLISRKIVSIRDVPSQLALISRGIHNCGASIISDYWALTAAHCVDGFSHADIFFRSGSSFRNLGGKIHPAKTIMVHPKFQKNTLDYDFALVKVSVAFYTKNGQYVNVLTSIEPKAGTFTLYGWGTFYFGGNKSLELTAINVTLLSREECSQKYKFSFTDRMICAGGESDACQGDSGGPLIHTMTGVQVGIVSWGSVCGSPQEPGVYSNIANQIHWIKNVSDIPVYKPKHIDKIKNV